MKKNTKQTGETRAEGLRIPKDRQDIAEVLTLVLSLSEEQREDVIAFFLKAIDAGALHDPGKMETLVSSAELTLKKCPKCGGAAKLQRTECSPYGVHIGLDLFFYQCNQCGYRTASALAGENLLPVGRVTPTEAQAKAMRYWQRDFTEDQARQRTAQKIRPNARA